MYCTNLMMTYDDTTISNPTKEPMMPFLAFAGSFPELAAKMYMIPETISAIVTIVPMKNVAESTTSCTNNPTEVASSLSLTLFLIHKVS